MWLMKKLCGGTSGWRDSWGGHGYEGVSRVENCMTRGVVLKKRVVRQEASHGCDPVSSGLGG